MIPKVKALPYILPSVSTANEGNEENVATAPYTRKAPYQYGWDWGPRYITIGIWKPVRPGDMGRRAHRELPYSSAARSVATRQQVSAEMEIESTHPQQRGDRRQPRRCRRKALTSRGDDKPFNSTPAQSHLDSTADRLAEALVSRGYGAQDRYRFSVVSEDRQGSGRTSRNKDRLALG